MFDEYDNYLEIALDKRKDEETLLSSDNKEIRWCDGDQNVIHSVEILDEKNKKYIYRRYENFIPPKGWFRPKQLEYDYKKMEEIEFKGDKPHGKSTGWYYNGQKSWEDEYKNGQLHGTSMSWKIDGQKYLEEEYQNGIDIETKEYKEAKMIELLEQINDKLNTLLDNLKH